MPTIALEIKDCTTCPHFKAERVYTPDSWDDVQKLTCTKADKVISGYHEWRDKLKVPEWCPLIIKTDKA